MSLEIMDALVFEREEDDEPEQVEYEVRFSRMVTYIEYCTVYVTVDEDMDNDDIGEAARDKMARRGTEWNTDYDSAYYDDEEIEDIEEV